MVKTGCGVVTVVLDHFALRYRFLVMPFELEGFVEGSRRRTVLEVGILFDGGASGLGMERCFCGR